MGLGRNVVPYYWVVIWQASGEREGKAATDHSASFIFRHGKGKPSGVHLADRATDAGFAV